MTTLLGREKELGLFGHCVENLARGRGGVVLVEGEPGIGKSALLRAGLAGVTDTTPETTLCRGAADELSRRFPLRALLECFGPEHRAEVIGTPVAHAGQDGWIGVADDPVLGALERLLSLVDRLCAAGPVALVLDDLHWADDTSLLAFSRLARLTTQHPLLLVTATRPVPGRAELGQLRRSLLALRPVLITLHPLRSDEVAELAGSLAGAPIGPRLSELVGNAGGNPLYVRELVAGLLCEERVDVSATAELTTRHGVISVPETISALIDERLRNLAESTRAMLVVAALLDTTFSFEDLAKMIGRPPGTLLGDVETAVTTGVLEQHGDQFTFRHPLIRTVLHDSTGAGLRTALHRQAARTLAESGAAAERVAEHLLLAPGTMTDPWALDWLSSEVAALAARSPKITADLLDEALAVLTEDDPRRDELQRWLVVLLRLLHDFDRAAELARRVLLRASDPDYIGHVTWVLGYCLFIMRRRPEMIEVLTDELDRHTDPGPWTARLRALLATVVNSTGRNDEAAAIAEQAAAEAKATGDGFALALASHAGSIAYFMTDSARSMDLISRGLLAVPNGPEGIDLRLLLLCNRARLLLFNNDLSGARLTTREAVELAERTGTARIALLRIISIEASYVTGRWDDAIAEMGPVDELRDDLGHYHSETLELNGMAGLIAVHRDDPVAAQECVAASRDIEIVPGERRKKSDFLLLTRASLAERRGHRAQAIATLAAALDPDYAPDLFRQPVLPMLIRLALAEGDFGRVTAAVRAAFTEAESNCVPGGEATIGWCRGLVAEDADALRSTASYYRTAERPLELGLVTEDLAELLARHGTVAEARAALTEAVTVYTRLGATWDVRRAERRLARFGVRRERTARPSRPKTGLAALTPTELAVARLVATGMSNSDIAARLMLSRRTVQTHVSHILAKLNARSRVEITRQLLSEH